MIEIRSGRDLKQDPGRPQRRTQCACRFIGRDAMAVNAANADISCDRPAPTDL